MAAQPRELRNYLTADGRSLLKNGLMLCAISQARKRIRLRLDQLNFGNLGDCKSIGERVFELRIDYDPGYRIYFGQDGLTLILLLCGGDKSSQKQDIRQAQIYWRDYEERENTNK